MGLNDDMEATVDAIYAAAVGRAAWPAALDHVLDVTGFTKASAYASNKLMRAVATEDHVTPQDGLWHRHDPGTQAEYQNEFVKLEPSRHYRLRHPNRRVYYDCLYGDDRELDRDPFYDWAERRHGVRYFAYGQTDPAQDITAMVVLHRPRRLGHIQADELDRFQVLLRHFDRAIYLENHLGQAYARDAGGLDFMDGNPTGIVILDAVGQPIVANHAARTMAAADDGLRLDRDGIAALRHKEDARLQRAIGAAIRASAGQPRAAGGSLRLPRPSGKRAYVVVVSPLPRRKSLLFDLLPAVCVMITDPDAALTPRAELLRQSFAITPAEARLVERLVNGETPEQAATGLGVALPTVRTQIAALYRKTETRRQPDLVRLLLSLPWWVR